MDNHILSENVNNYLCKTIIRGTNGISTIPYIYAQPQSHNFCNGGLSSDCEVETSFKKEILTNPQNIKPPTMIVGDNMRNQTVLMSDNRRNSNPIFCVGVCTKGITVISEECDDEMEDVATFESREGRELADRVDWDEQSSCNIRGGFWLFMCYICD